MEKEISPGDAVTHNYYGPGVVNFTENNTAYVMFERNSDPFNLTVVPLKTLKRIDS